MREKMLAALKLYAEGQIELHKMNVEVYLTNPAGIGEHPDVAEALDTQVEKYATAKEKYDAVESILIQKPQTTLTE